MISLAFGHRRGMVPWFASHRRVISLVNGICLLASPKQANSSEASILPGRIGCNEPRSINLAENLGRSFDATPWSQARNGCPRATYRGYSPSNSDEWYSNLTWFCDENELHSPPYSNCCLLIVGLRRPKGAWFRRCLGQDCRRYLSRTLMRRVHRDYIEQASFWKPLR